MSVNYYAYTYLGFEVTKEEFWREEVGVVRACPHHSSITRGRFCSLCGHELVLPSRLEMTPAMEALRHATGTQLLEVDDFWDELVDEGVGPDCLQFRCLDPSQSSEGAVQTMGVAICLAEIDPYEENPEPVWEGDLRDKIAYLSDLSKRMFGKERVIKLYTVLYASV